MPVSGDRPAALDDRDAPGCPPGLACSWPRASATSFVLAAHLPARTGNVISSCTQTLLEPRLATAPGQDARLERATPLLQTGSREKSVRPGTSPEPAPTRAVMEDINSRGQPPTAPDRMNAKTRGKMRQNSPPPQESTSPPARSIASHKGSADRTKSSAAVASTSSTAHTSATISRRESAGRSSSESRSMVKRYDACCICPHLPHGLRQLKRDLASHGWAVGSERRRAPSRASATSWPVMPRRVGSAVRHRAEYAKACRRHVNTDPGHPTVIRLGLAVDGARNSSIRSIPAVRAGAGGRGTRRRR